MNLHNQICILAPQVRNQLQLCEEIKSDTKRSIYLTAEI